MVVVVALTMMMFGVMAITVMLVMVVVKRRMKR